MPQENNEILNEMKLCFSSEKSSLNLIKISDGIEINYTANSTGNAEKHDNSASCGFYVTASKDFKVGQVAAIIPKEASFFFFFSPRPND
jgi:hypothetical protein